MAAAKSKKTSIDNDALRPVLIALSVLGAIAAGWSAFLWRELVSARSGGDPFCGFGESGDCVQLWDGGFASAVHSMTGMPIAGWGVIWGLIACILPILALVKSATPAAEGLRSATRVTALVGLLTVTVMVMVSVLAGSFCTSCALIYILAVAYAAIASLKLKTQPSSRGLMVAAGATAICYLALLYPGLQTPKSDPEALSAAIDRATSSDATSADGSPTLESFLASLPPDHRQGVSNALYMYSTSPVFPEREPRDVVIGADEADVRITNFSDSLCSHCADLHKAYAYLEASLPEGSFRADARHYPLDGGCNPYIERTWDDDVRCVAAKAQICMEGSPNAFDFGTALYEAQQGLTGAKVLEISQTYGDRSELETCLADPETDAKLLQDIEYAQQYRPRGTPLVLVNGRQGTSFESFLYAVVLAGGRPDHPAFADLPPPSFGS